MHVRPLALASVLLLAGLGPTVAQDIPGAGVAVDPQAYEGLWYEIARLPAPFQQHCEGGVTARYEFAAGGLRVVNRCDLPGGEVDRVEGAATALNESFNAFNVDFPGSPPSDDANYLVVATGDVEDGLYAWAAVLSPDDQAWILSRTPALDGDARQEAEEALGEVGVDVARLQDTRQPPANYDPGAD